MTAISEQLTSTAHELTLVDGVQRIPWDGMPKKNGGAGSRGLYPFLGGGFRCVFFSPLLGEMMQFDEYSSNGLKPPTSFVK